MISLISLLTGALLTLGANFFLQRWRYGREAVDKRCDEIEKAAFDLAVAAREYWLKAWPILPIREIGTQSEAEIEMLSAEARIVGLSQRLQGLGALIAFEFPISTEPKLQQPLSILLDQATGGDFEVRRRQRDLSRARGVEAAAADYVVAVREAATKRWALDKVGIWRKRRDAIRGWYEPRFPRT